MKNRSATVRPARQVVTEVALSMSSDEFARLIYEVVTSDLGWSVDELSLLGHRLEQEAWRKTE